MQSVEDVIAPMYKRIIVKVGTKVLSAEDGTLDVGVLKHLVGQVVAVKNKGIAVVLVTSGAMGAGRSLVALAALDGVAEKQVLAAVGQVKLMSMYAEFFTGENQICAQVLATKEDFRDKIHYLNMRTCFENLLAGGVVPVVNENDVVATTELLFTDNDELAGLVASQLNADAAVILTSVEGFLTGDPKDAASKVIPEIDFNAAGSYRKYISPDKTAFGRGGMLTKFHIAKKLTRQGIAVHFANGRRKNVLTDIVEGKNIGTKFLPRGRSSAIKRRLAYSEGLTKGTVRVNTCAEDLLLSKTKIMSLLPVGVISIEGDFSKGDIIAIVGEKGQKLGFGIAEYGASKAKALMGAQKARPVVHYNHMFIGA
jgi:glutamate 5-kinase